ncbi:pyoverdine/dityrosine biosynthesis protein [Blastomyces gilchristii SLH14081]|uniref:Pyoverdine/dityrosine biosynthesis protein n=1 Tax=Blastomyces gilchristii (strain SLH14081) TaxID=559298 RepID=A0A179UIM8_BLAGS|nr:pyoverdine/dityrosine biosynthesis protein [Blastomyces gilchristii SLH14081]OAT07844.1 pyoverdine/dityrosine biosynthesis protein [Blastomyces gilchristii SLH14081]
MSSDDISNNTCNTRTCLAAETDLVAMIRKTCTFDHYELSNACRGNLLHVLDMPSTQQAVKEGNHSIMVYLENGTDIVFENRRRPEDIPAIRTDGKTQEPCPFGPKTSEDVSNAIVSILETYRMAPKEHAHEPWEAKTKISSLVREYIELGEVIPMVLPAFPFKSPNKKFKVLGHLPDKGEEVALAHLNELCKLIENEYTKGGRIDIVSDGLMYNDLLGISDKEVWAYGQALRKLAVDTGCSNINFVRLVHLLGEVEMGEPLSEEEYLKDASWFRTQLHERNIPENFDVSAFISSDPDTTLTYRGYIKFLEKDLDHDNSIDDASVSKRQIKKRHEATAKNMITRGRAFAIAIARRFDKSIRLSIHPSTESTKVSIAITPQKDGMIMTPWHSSLVYAVDGSIRMAHAGSVPALTHELIFEHGRPVYFREKSPLYDWGSVDVEFRYTYPSGIIISPRNKSCKCRLNRVDMRKVRVLAGFCSPVILRGWLETASQGCCFETDVASGKCRHGNIGMAKFCNGITPGVTTGCPRMRPTPSHCEAGALRDFDSEGSTICDHVPCQQIVSSMHKTGTSSQSLLHIPPDGCGRCLAVDQHRGNPQAENRPLNEVPNPPKSYSAWKVLKDWSDMCIMS